MAENTVSSKDTPRQEPIKHFEAGVVSYFLFHDFHDDIDLLLRRLKFLARAGFDDEHMDTALDLIERLILSAESKLGEMNKRAVKESNEAGGNDIYTISMNESLKMKGRKSPGNGKKWKSIFEDDRFLMYVAQIRLDGHDPADILKVWLKEHNPEFLKDD